MIFPEIDGWAFHETQSGSDCKWMARHPDTNIVGLGDTKMAAAHDLMSQVDVPACCVVNS